MIFGGKKIWRKKLGACGSSFSSPSIHPSSTFHSPSDMTRLSKSDNNTLRGQEWRLLKACGPGSLPSTSLPSTSLLSLAVDQHQLSEKYQHDTFLIKTFFDATEKCYLILLTNFKQCWFEKLELEGIRKRSMVLPFFLSLLSPVSVQLQTGS